MTATTSVISDLLSPDVVQSIADDVWTAMFEDYVVPIGPVPVPDGAVFARVSVAGPWNGDVVVSCARQTADALTRALLRTAPDEELGVEDVEDALGELANVLGGNVKAALPGPSQLSLPQLGHSLAPVAPGDTCRIDLMWRDQPLTITIQGTRPGTPTHAHVAGEKDEVPL